MILRNLSRSSKLLRSKNISPAYTLRTARLPIRQTLILPYRTFASQLTADEKIEEIQELYATAKDEFEIASEETDKKTVYAADDRAAAHEELGKLKAAFEEAVKSEHGEEIKRRIGQRIRELDRAVEAMEEKAKED
ncbi:uncharacterized protein KY384_001840 [Bacidia gigantensis]|uniref:uncharacterized protein n=1 Tax=Bacidia gigantensis TaxID=2732470 RepID=UPI001D03ED29|nr:uncharacterized protein KY384_001840 [Bacidia gigantensis]KAG8533057.1 hypothetical protein KY384_001840 [Bacidia gigantensis]